MTRYAFLLIILWIPLSLSARDYTIPRINIQAEIEPDATIRYVEERLYRFDGEYSFAYYTLPLEGFEAIENIRVRQNGRALVNDDSESPGTFKVQKNRNELRITWFFETSGITEHLFTIQYDLKEALVKGPDVSEWFWIFLSERLDRTPENFRTRISLPEIIPENEWHVWLRNTPGHINKRIDGNLLYLEGEGFSSSDRVIARIVFPTTVLPDAEITDPAFGLDQAIGEEEAWVEAQRRERQMFMLGTGLLIILVPASLFLYVWFYRRYGRRHKPRNDIQKIRYSPPSDHPPALIRMLILGPLVSEPDKLGLGITLFDLARRGYYRIVEKTGEKKFLGSETPYYHLEKTGKKPENNLSAWERELLDKVNKRIDEGVHRLDKVLDWSDKSSRKWWKAWRKLFKKSVLEQEWFDSTSGKAMIFYLMAQFPFLLAMIAVTLLAGRIGIAGLIFMAMMMALSLTLPKRTQKGENLFVEWSAYRKALKKGPNRSFQQEEMGHHFVNAIALGLTKKQLEKRLSGIEAGSPIFLWVIPLTTASSPAEMASGLSTLASSGTSSFSGVSGVGGASAGSAGGGAGGGAG